jgi:hypothetical protein
MRDLTALADGHHSSHNYMRALLLSQDSFGRHSCLADHCSLQSKCDAKTYQTETVSSRRALVTHLASSSVGDLRSMEANRSQISWGSQ